MQKHIHNLKRGEGRELTILSRANSTAKAVKIKNI